MATIAISINTSWNVLNFRGGLVTALRNAGHDVLALTPPDEDSAALASIGATHVAIPIKPRPGLPHEELGLIGRYLATIRRTKPDVFLGFTAKPNVYGSIAAHILGIPVINNVSGLGTAFIRGGILGGTLALLYRLAFRRSHVVFFQNPDDRDLFIGRRLVTADQARILPGSGVNLVRFAPVPPREVEHKTLTFLLVARMLRDKGVVEFVHAARMLRDERAPARFQLLGFVNADNQTAISQPQIDAWVAEGVVEYLGDTKDVRPFIATADCVVLPSYREGLPRSLLEASAMGKPLIASDVPGCRHIARDGENAVLCPVKDTAGLADAMRRVIGMAAGERQAMGARGRRIVEEEFDERLVASHYLSAVNSALEASRRR